MYLLAADIKFDSTSISFENLLVLCSFALVLIAIVFINGFSIKIGDKEINIGGILRLLARKDEDVLLKENLHRFSEEIDHSMNGELYDLVDSLNYEIEGIALKEHCYFTFEKFISILKTELEKRVRRNNLKEKLSNTSRERYVEGVMKNIEAKYEMLQAKVTNLKCGESYAQFSSVKDAVRKILYQFFDGAKEILIEGCKKKVKRYNEDKSKFKTVALRISSCDLPIEKNELYIKGLE